MTILQVIGGRERDLGGFVVRRVLPAAERQMIGPFIFFDHLGPTTFAPHHGIDVRPHPHVALATVTYLFSGAIEHRDSLGSVQVIRPGDVNWMTAGHGITHSERTPAAPRAAGDTVHGLQSWVALPDGDEDIEPAFDHHPAATLPRRALGGVELVLVAGEAFGLRSPVITRWPTLYVDARFAASSGLRLENSHEERAVYVVAGSVDIDGTAVHLGQLAVIAPGATPDLRALAAAHVMLLGGARFPTPRHLWWNFVASSEARIQAAKARWRNDGFPAVPGETEFIPLPET
jgi:redox-sensitive bicupin YhaK (pirin superfamily)